MNVTAPDAADPSSRLFGPKLPTVTYGATLSRLVDFSDAQRFIESKDRERMLGGIYIELWRSHMPATVNVEAAIKLDPAVALLALQVADQRIRSLHNLDDRPIEVAAIDEVDAQAIRQMAEDLVKAVRSRPPSPEDFKPKQFDLTFEEAVRAVVVALAKAPLGARRLAEAL